MALPRPILEGDASWHEVARQCEQKREGMLGRSDGIPCRRVDNEDTASRRRFDINVIHTDSGAPDDFEPRCRVN